MASFILKGMVTNDGINRLKMASTVYEKEISEGGSLGQLFRPNGSLREEKELKALSSLPFTAKACAKHPL